ncbi:MAG: cysteine synthase family protein [Myxococcales bacterium]|nr:cysteine synthase family protein [Myxococcales bacterium]
MSVASARRVSELIGNTPLVRLERLDAGARQPVLAKCEHLNPGGSIKDRIALAIIADAEQRGLLAPGATIVEATAGNTGVGLALVGAERGYNVACVMPNKMSVDKRRALAAQGAQVIITPDVSFGDPQHFQAVAARLADERGWFLADQFRNPANVEVHARETAREILEQTGGRVGAFVVGAGTGGTISGVGRALKAHDARVRVVLADPAQSALAAWVEHGELGEAGSYKVEGIGGSVVPENLHGDVIDEALRVSDEDSFATAARLWREQGLLVGGSAGTNVAAALRVAARDDIDGAVVTVLPDGWDRYRSTEWMQRLADG